jgi:hypothetical protein
VLAGTSPNRGVKNSWQEAHNDGSFGCNSAFKMESTNMLSDLPQRDGAGNLTGIAYAEIQP